MATGIHEKRDLFGRAVLQSEPAEHQGMGAGDSKELLPETTNEPEVFYEYVWNTLKYLADQNHLPADPQSIADAETVVLSHHPNGDMAVLQAVGEVYGARSPKRIRAALKLADLYRAYGSGAVGDIDDDAPETEHQIDDTRAVDSETLADSTHSDEESSVPQASPAVDATEAQERQPVLIESPALESQVSIDPVIPDQVSGSDSGKSSELVSDQSAQETVIELKPPPLGQPPQSSVKIQTASTEKIQPLAPLREARPKRSLDVLRKEITSGLAAQLHIDNALAAALLDHRRPSFTPDQGKLLRPLRELFGVYDTRVAEDTSFRQFSQNSALTPTQNRRLAWFTGFRITTRNTGVKFLVPDTPYSVGKIRNAARNSDGPDAAERDVLTALEKLFGYF